MAIERYNGFAQALHWLTVAALCLVLPCVWVAENFPPGPVRVLWYLAHESMGISVALLVLIRLTWRWRHRAPAYRAEIGAGTRVLAHLNHGLLYTVLLTMPVTGYLMAGNGQDVPFFGLVSLPGFVQNEALGKFANTVHVWGQFALYGLIIMHVAATVWHVAVRRDGMLERMLPPQRD
ncbi:cytochrome b [Pseudomonas sp. CFBP 8771]|uniref:cytochrome b n=1 Tax=Pseudomonas sp. CFBP 8771 TaxID=2775285 RepID=UPI001781654E|nr:cytochrome b [Pseudomonas sp. CFBP 8771]MBD8604286.1 cytochrome b [Pseudomonas sp. CFBP 8771]